MDKGFELGSVIHQLRSELQAAAEKSKGQDLRFGVEGVELEIKAALKKSEEVSCGFKVYVFSLGGGKKSENEHTITVKLRLTPRRRKSEGTEPSGDFEVSRVISEPEGPQRRPRRR